MVEEVPALDLAQVTHEVGPVNSRCLAHKIQEGVELALVLALALLAAGSAPTHLPVPAATRLDALDSCRLYQARRL